jgi:hypothetical protein
MNRRGIILFSLVIFCLILSSPVWGEFKLTPSISIREEYDDNIFLTADNEKGDFITSIYPSISLGYTSNLLTLSLDYGVNFRFYLHNSDQNETDLTNTQRAKLDSTVSLYRDIFFIKVFDEYARVPIDVRKQTAINNQFVNMTDSNHFLVNPYILYPLSGTLQAKAGYSYENVWYKDKAGDDLQSHLMTIGLIKEFSPKLSTSLFYTYSINNYKITEDYDRQDIVFGMNYQLTEKFSLQGSFGYAWLNYKEAEDYNSDIWSIDAKYLLTEKVSVGAGYSQNFMNSVDQGTYKNDGAAAFITWQGSVPVTLRGFMQKSDYIIENREDKSTGVSLSGDIPLTPKLTAKITGLYTYYKFSPEEGNVNPEEEKANRYGVGITFDYAIRITTISIGYIHDLNDSNIEQNDYRDNRFSVGARFTL